jgi:hypothetical protein
LFLPCQGEYQKQLERCKSFERLVQMIPAQIYCTAKQVLAEIKLRGSTDLVDVMERIEAASMAIQNRDLAGNYTFIPITEVRKFGKRRGYEDRPLVVGPLLSFTSLVNDGETITDYHLKPYNREWANGPYTTIETEGAWANDDDVVITGKWGLYEETVGLEPTATQTTSSETTLVVTNGSLLSPGMVLLIGDEQELVTGGAGSVNSPAAAVATSKLNGAITSELTEITVDNGGEFHPGEVIQIGLEDVSIWKINGNLMAVERGWNGTNAADHVDDSVINIYRTFLVTRGVNGTPAASHSATAIYQYVVPNTVNWLCRQIAVLMRMKAESNFTGVTANAEMGQGKYYSEFPPNQMDEVLRPFKLWD